MHVEANGKFHNLALLLLWSVATALLHFTNSGAELLCADLAADRRGQSLSPAVMLVKSPSGSA
jgi:hypothetical protein